MIRLWLLFAGLTGIELWAFQVYRNHPLLLPEYFKMVLLCIQFIMCWGAVDAARWLLRRSPAARRSGPVSDWLRLWLWVGPSGGALLVLACLIGRWTDSISTSRLAGPLVVAHISGGALAWVLAAFWAVPELFGDSQTTLFDKLMALAGIAAHALGLWVYLRVYPGSTLSLVTLVAPMIYFALLLYYVLAATLVWDVFFRVAKRQS